MTGHDELGRKLRAHLLLAPREGDHLMLSDDVLGAALDGSMPLSAGERAALQASPLTRRRLRTLALARRARWQASGGMLRAADSGAALTELSTDDGYWTLHFVGTGAACRVIVQLAPQAPFAEQLLREQPLLRVVDGAGAVVLQGRLDADGECEAPWPFDAAPAQHFQQHGARFGVEALRP